MKKFSDFISESNNSKAGMQARRLGLSSDGHGGWEDKNGEFVAKTKGLGPTSALNFYNQKQTPGQDPKRVVTQKSQYIAATQTQAEEYQKILREKYIKKEIFNIGEWVENIANGMVGKIIRRGTNYLICVTEDDKMFKPWIKDVKEWTNISGVPANQREVGTDALRKYVMGMSNTKKILNFNVKNFINKYKAKSN
jgi:hypothetical protein